MRYLIILLYTFTLFSCAGIKKKVSVTGKSAGGEAGVATSTNSSDSFYFPPQWEEQEAVWLGWSLSPTVQQLHLQMIRALEGNVRITIMARSESLLNAAFRQLHTAGVDTTNLKGYVHFIPNPFIRDAGPRFLRNDKGDLAIADFGWNNYGYPEAFTVSQYSDRRGEIDNDLAIQLNVPVATTTIVAEGGAFDMTTDVLMCFKETALQRNQEKQLQEIEEACLRMYRKKKMIWLNRMPLMDRVVAGPKSGNYFGYGDNGHVDEFIRFVNDSTVLIALVDPQEKNDDPVSSGDYVIMQENLKILKEARDPSERPFNIIPAPTPSYRLFAEEMVLTDSIRNLSDGRALYKNNRTGERVYWMNSVSYANFFISNGVVLVAKYWKKGLPQSVKTKDEQVKNILHAVFPERKIVQLNPIALNRWGGGMHCATQQQPKRKSSKL